GELDLVMVSLEGIWEPGEHGLELEFRKGELIIVAYVLVYERHGDLDMGYVHYWIILQVFPGHAVYSWKYVVGLGHILGSDGSRSGWL
ncbi:hypothetical protein BGZ76_006984, partial [Entomortierella beljakovae]